MYLNKYHRGPELKFRFLPVRGGATHPDIRIADIGRLSTPVIFILMARRTTMKSFPVHQDCEACERPITDPPLPRSTNCRTLSNRSYSFPLFRFNRDNYYRLVKHEILD